MLKQYDPDVLKRLQKAELNILKDFDKVCSRHGIHYFLIGGSLLGAIRHNGFIPWDDDLDIGMTRKDYDKFLKIMPKEMGNQYILATPLRHDGYCSAVVKLMRKGTKFVPDFAVEMKCELGIHIDIFIWDNLCSTRFGAWRQIKEARILSQLIFLCGSSRPNIEYGAVVRFILLRICGLIHWLFCKSPDMEKRLYKRFEKVCKRANQKDTKFMTTFASIIPYRDICKKEWISKEAYTRKQFAGFDAMVQKECKKYIKRVFGENYMELPPVEERYNHCAGIIDFGDKKRACISND